MTREERELSITYLEEMKEAYIEGEGYERHPLPEYYAIECAIKALDQQPCEDCISRADVLGLAKKGVLISNSNYQSVCKAINELPPVTPKYTDEEIDRAQAIEQAYIDKMVELVAEEAKRPKGKWEYVQYDYNPNIGNWHCSECRFMFVMSGVPEYKYCPNCGARMLQEDS